MSSLPKAVLPSARDLFRAIRLLLARALEGAALGCGVFGLVFALLPQLPPSSLDYASHRSTRILDRDGALLYERRSEIGGYGRWVELDAIAPQLQLATLSGEDASFRDHLGISAEGLVRALWLNLREGRLGYGGSTISQQLAGLLERRPRTLAGKLEKMLHALRLERTLSKDEILTHYLNRAYYGRLAYGVEAAAQRFFGKSASELRLDESALLAVLPRGPSLYNPDRHPARLLRRRAHLLEGMAARGWISAAEAERAAVEPLRLVDAAQQPRARHLLDHLSNEGLVPAGIPAQHTTIDLALQEQLERRVRMHLLDMRDRAVAQAGVIVLENATGEVLAMVGSRRYEGESLDGAVNAVTAPRHPGSTLKPFVYALALEQGARPSSPVLDLPATFHDYRPRSLDGEHRGLISYRAALAGSLNVPAVRVAQRVGMPRLLETLRRVGLRTIDPDPGEHGLALALGAAPVRLLDLAGAYAMLARGGTYLEPRFIAGPPGAEPPPRILSSESAYLISSILSDARARGAAFGPETPLELPFEAAAKTGTSQAYCDNLVVGYTPQITVAVWVGNFDGQPMRGLLSMQGAAPLWRDAMLAAMRGRPRLRFERPPGVEPALTCPLSGLARGAHCPSGRLEPIDRTRGPLPSCSWHGPEGLRLPLSLFAGVSGAPEVLAASGEHAPLEAADSLRILSPLEGDVIVLDPLLNPASQALPLVALVGATGLSAFWELDGERLAATPTPLAMAEIGAGDGGAGIEALRALWAPVPGRHQLRAVVETAQGAISSRVEFSVEPIGGGA